MKPRERSVDVRLESTHSFRRTRQPIAIGLPWPKGWVRDESLFRLSAPPGETDLFQTQVLDRWSDGSIRWCLFDFFASTGSASGYRILAEGDPSALPASNGSASHVGFPKVVFDDPGSAIAIHGKRDVAVRITLRLESATINVALRAVTAESGPVKTRIHVASREPLPDGLEIFGFMDLYSGMSTLRMRLSLRNTKPCAHPGGTWDLGNPGSTDIREFSIALCSPDSGKPIRTQWSAEPDSPLSVESGSVELFQASSGGENWNHHNHLDRNRRIPHEFRGYRVSKPSGAVSGLRSTPVFVRECGDQFHGVAVPHFWENFPQLILSDNNALVLEFFPRRDNLVHELMGGEQKTWDFHIAFGPDEVSDIPLNWCRDPIVAHADPEWYAASGAVPHLMPAGQDRNTAYRALVDQAIEGPGNFFEKREAIDEYGWRNFGDVHADHEAVFHKGPERLVSHYNNQFDVVNGCALQFLRSADRRWWNLLIPAADHTCDIDTYHTTGDKGAYNGGLFPFTFHYCDADTSGHRGYPRALQSATTLTFGRDLNSLGPTGEALKKAIARGLGGGPSASHIYNHGLMLAWFLTGIPQYRDEAVGQAEYILRMDRPSRLLSLLSGEYSGGATPSGSSDYHGPGRAGANSILALLVGHRLTGRREFLEKAEQLIRRVSHPKQNLESLDLLNAELRWFYVMHLQTLGEYLEYKAELGEIDDSYAYARFTLLHFARWMARHECPFLSRQADLQYPTETWPAQDMRKVEVFQFAAKHAEGDEKAVFLKRADWFFRHVEESLSGFPTRSFCRPVNLMMNFGSSRSWWQANPDAQAPVPSIEASPEDFGEWTMFVPQRRRAVRRFKILVAVSAILFVLGLALLVASFV